MFQIHKKNNLAKNLNKMRKMFPSDYSFYPKTFLLPIDQKEFLLEFGVSEKKTKWFANGKFITLTQLRAKRSESMSKKHKEAKSLEKKKKGESKIFIAKPDSSAQGKGISIITHPSQIMKLEKYIVQEYINR